MKIKSIILLSTLALPLIAPHVVFASEKSTEQKLDPAVAKNIELIDDYIRYANIRYANTFNMDNMEELPGTSYNRYFDDELYQRNPSGVEEYQNRANDIEEWKKLILNNQYHIRDAEHRAFIKNIIKKSKEHTREEVRLLFFVQKFIKKNIANTEYNLAQQKSKLSKYKLAITAFPELLINESKLKELTPDNSIKLDNPIEFIFPEKEATKYDVHIEIVKSDEIKDFSIQPELQEKLATLSESERLLLKTKPGLIIEISELVSLSNDSGISHDGYLLYSFTLDESKSDIKNVYLIRLIPHDAQNINAEKDSKIYSAKALSEKIQRITGQKSKSTRFISSDEKENLGVNRSFSRRDSKNHKERQQIYPNFSNYPDEQRPALEEAYNPEAIHNQRYFPKSQSYRSNEEISGVGNSSQFLPPIATRSKK